MSGHIWAILKDKAGIIMIITIIYFRLSNTFYCFCYFLIEDFLLSLYCESQPFIPTEDVNL